MVYFRVMVKLITVHIMNASTRLYVILGGLLLATIACQSAGTKTQQSTAQPMSPQIASSGLDTATFAGGCFWCTEALFQQLEGVDTVISGYIGGHVGNPTYRQVIRGNTGHAEAVNIIYDTEVLSYEELLEAFFMAHDPTQLNRQGNDVGPQYRSAVFYHTEEEKRLAEFYIRRLEEEKVYAKPIVTRLEPYTTFYVAEDYHQNYFRLNPEQAYCQYVIVPKLEKFREVFAEKLKK